VTIPVEGGHWLPERHPGTVAAAVVAQLDHAVGQYS